ncbi:MAG: hypothetical protein IPL42_01735 [Saprospiraceae bacterium]|nr:hypothetical protein [Saprospiraceae bacterium]
MGYFLNLNFSLRTIRSYLNGLKTMHLNFIENPIVYLTKTILVTIASAVSKSCVEFANTRYTPELAFFPK